MAIEVRIFDVVGGQMFVRYSGIDPAREMILFIHGIGESGLCFIETLTHPSLAEFNIVIPDLPGFGRSSEAETGDYSLEAQASRIGELLDLLEVESVHIVGHSMGGDIGTDFCERRSHAVRSFVNVEGNLTSADGFITRRAMEVERDGNFEEWLRGEFCHETVVGWAIDSPSVIRYLASIHMCRSEAFRRSAREICQLNRLAPDGNGSISGQRFMNLTLPRKCFCWAAISEDSKLFLSKNSIPNREFPGASHWVMIDAADDFYAYVAEFVSDCSVSR